MDANRGYYAVPPPNPATAPMCLIVIAWQQHAGFPLVIAANRDEYHARPSEAAAFWRTQPRLLAGRDLRAGGTWLGLTRGGRFAAITNRRGHEAPAGAPSRGMLTLDFLLGDDTPGHYAERLAADCERYAGFNLLVGEVHGELHYLGNHGPRLERLPPGVYGLSNAMLDTPWPKLLGAREEVAALLAGDPDPGRVLAVLADRGVPPDHALPATGVGLDQERLLGPRFVCSAPYGTRTSTCVRVRRDGQADFTERRFDPAGTPQATVQYTFRLD
ncbi:MAG: hypothetical protein CALGDGBN_01290 [Pseudomonadales bacterium]|nr:hypothetical protein [Pseudomonadales bacterium]